MSVKNYSRRFVFAMSFLILLSTFSVFNFHSEEREIDVVYKQEPLATVEDDKIILSKDEKNGKEGLMENNFNEVIESKNNDLNYTENEEDIELKEIKEGDKQLEDIHKEEIKIANQEVGDENNDGEVESDEKEISGIGGDNLNANDESAISDQEKIVIQNLSGDFSSTYKNYNGTLNNPALNYLTQGSEEVTKEITSECECYEIGSAEVNQPAGSMLSFSNNNEASYDYTPVDDGRGMDCSVTNIKLSYPTVSFGVDSEDTETEFAGITSNLEIIDDGNGKIALALVNDGSRAFGSGESGNDADSGKSITTDDEGNIYMTGSFEGEVDFDNTEGDDVHTSNGDQDVFITRYNADGSYGWTRTFGDAGDESGNDIFVTSLGDVYVVGYFAGDFDFDGTAGEDIYESSNNSIDIFITKYNADGTYGFTIILGNVGDDLGLGVVVDLSNGIYAAGSFEGTIDFDVTGSVDEHTSNGRTDAFITKYNLDGSYGWTRTFGSNNVEEVHDVATDSLGNVYVTGHYGGTVDFDATAGDDTHFSKSDQDVFITRYNADGSYGWTRVLGSAGSEEGNSIFVDSFDHVYVLGDGSSTNIDFDSTAGEDIINSEKTFITSYNTDGSYNWTRVFDISGSADSHGAGIFADVLGDIYMTGYFCGETDFDGTTTEDIHNPMEGCDTFITKYNADGSYSWTRTFGGSGDESGNDIVGDSVGNIYVTGDFQNTVDFDASERKDIQESNGSSDIFFVRYDYNGDFASFTDGYKTPGTYQTQINSAGTLKQWNQLTISEELVNNTEITYEILDRTCSTTLIPQTSNTNINLSSIDISNTSLCLQINFSTTDDQVTPKLDSWQATYFIEGDDVNDTIKYNMLVDPTCTLNPVCGNDLIENGEECDDGNTKDDDGCSSECKQEQYEKPKDIKAEFFWDSKDEDDLVVSNMQSFYDDAYILVTWEDWAKKESGYVIERSVNGGKFEKLDNLDKNTESYIDRDIEPGNSYSYRVYTKYDGENGEKSKKATVTIPPFRQGQQFSGVIETSTIETPIEEDAGKENNGEEKDPNNSNQNERDNETEGVADNVAVDTTNESEKQPIDYQEVAKNSVTIAGIISGIYALVVSSLLSFSVNPLTTNPFSAVLRFLTLPFGRKKEEYYQGIVFDAVTKQAIQNIPVRITDVKTGLVKATIVTNEEGRYGFLPERGNYRLEIDNPNYQLNTQQFKDELYGEIYQGQTITISKEEEKDTVISPNISLIPPNNFNWKQFAKKEIKKNQSNFRKLINILSQILFIAGLIWSVISVIIAPNIIWNWIILTLYIILAFYQLMGRKKQKRFGKVCKLSDEKPIPFARLNLKKEDKTKKFTVSDTLGRYLLLSPEGIYKLEAKGTSLEGQPYNKEKKVRAVKGVVNEKIEI